ncbi:MAG: ATP-binding protein [Clostridium sp.]|nr:ATP-binding protein [Clostridium sp.]
MLDEHIRFCMLTGITKYGHLSVFSVLRLYGNVTDSQVLVLGYRQQLEQGDIEGFIASLTRFFARVPFDLRRNVERFENYYHSLFYVIVRLLGMDIKAEYHTSEGSVDILIETDRFIYVIELKMRGDAEAAMRQIKQRNYAAQFAGDPRRLFKVALGFSESTHTIDSFLID